MIDSQRSPFYSVDTSALIDWQFRFYPTDVFYSLLGKVDQLIKEKRFSDPALARSGRGRARGGLAAPHLRCATGPCAQNRPDNARELATDRAPGKFHRASRQARQFRRGSFQQN